MCYRTKLQVLLSLLIPMVLFVVAFDLVFTSGQVSASREKKSEITGKKKKANKKLESQIQENVLNLIEEGRSVFRFDTFGDEDFWGGQLQLHKAIDGSNGGSGLSPNRALELGLKVDADALPQSLIQQIKAGEVDFDDPATTVTLIRHNAVVGVTGFFNADGTTLNSIGIQCAICHSTVDDSFSFGIGQRLDGWANRDLDIGAIVALAPNLQPIAEVLTVDVETVKKVLNSWGPGKFDAELLLDGKSFNDKGDSSATLIPNAFGLLGFNLHTWTGGWGTVTYWNAFVANIELHGKGNFFDTRLDDTSKFPVAAQAGFGHLQADPDEDKITSKLPALHFYQLALPVPIPIAGTHFDADAAERGDELFNGKARCGTCHIEPLWTEPGWNTHKPDDIGIDSFQANRSPDNSYKTMNLEGLHIRELGLHMKTVNKGRFYHDGRFATLKDVVNHYNSVMGLGLTDQEKNDLVEYLKSL